MTDAATIPYDGDKYYDTPLTRALIARADRIKASLPPVEDGHTRLWRGNRPGEVGRNPSYTNFLAGIALPFLRGYGGDLSYLDVPTGALKEYVCTAAAATNSEFMLPPGIVQKAKIVERSVAAPATEVEILWEREAVAPKPRRPPIAADPPGPTAKGWEYF